ncbi:class I SAM-dependent methyltransferase [Phaeobacter sp. QD34_3]|uniref:class I SAM-dependent methyltransferase n=1 Tax=unclassified Phaeobacter TaxID=2621772 RepID=UPI00237EF7BF|nr:MULTISPECIES: class I SAM-dependent methyltransferase [unclassified Phaeobacter]MDE4132725.1 class I SAM-dependent methyltransferase [Phaeobacter sp. QD34_3]MDE4136482.1 class I SAM-dependent methyltransferase [Phaeobacter sp. QD34_24]
MTDRKAHWNAVYTRKDRSEVSWYQAHPEASLKALSLVGRQDVPFVDIGGGASDLAKILSERGWRDLTVLDISEAALAVAGRRLGEQAAGVAWIVANITDWTPPRRYEVWHDRAVFHFLTDEKDRAAYVAALKAGVCSGGHVILATFAPDGPEKCSGLPVRRYSAGQLAAELGSEFDLRHHWREMHEAPGGAEQSFTWTVFQRR